MGQHKGIEITSGTSGGVYGSHAYEGVKAAYISARSLFSKPPQALEVSLFEECSTSGSMTKAIRYENLQARNRLWLSLDTAGVGKIIGELPKCLAALGPVLADEANTYAAAVAPQ